MPYITKNKSIDFLSNIMSKRHGIFIKTLPYLTISYARKNRNVLELNLTSFRRPSFCDDINVTFI